MNRIFSWRDWKRHFTRKPVEPFVSWRQLTHEGGLRPQQVQPLVRDHVGNGAGANAFRELETKWNKIKLNVETCANNKGSKNARIPSDNWNQRFFYSKIFFIRLGVSIWHFQKVETPKLFFNPINCCREVESQRGHILWKTLFNGVLWNIGTFSWLKCWRIYCIFNYFLLTHFSNIITTIFKYYNYNFKRIV